MDARAARDEVYGYLLRSAIAATICVPVFAVLSAVFATVIYPVFGAGVAALATISTLIFVILIVCDAMGLLVFDVFSLMSGDRKALNPSLMSLSAAPLSMLGALSLLPMIRAVTGMPMAVLTGVMCLIVIVAIRGSVRETVRDTAYASAMMPAMAFLASAVAGAAA